MQVFKTEEELKRIRLEEGLKEYITLFLSASVVVSVIALIYLSL